MDSDSQFTIRRLSFGDPQFDVVHSIYRANSSSLGFLTLGAFEEALIAGRILVAVDRSGRLLSYLLYRVSYRFAVVTHLCSTESARGKGIATALVEYLIEDVKGSLLGIRAKTRRDYSVAGIWRKLNFKIVKEEQGRGKDRATVYTWSYSGSQQAALDLFPKTKPLAVLDTNILIDIQDTDEEDSVALMQDWLTDFVTLAFTEQFRVDIAENPDPAEREKRLGFAHGNFQLIGASSEEISDLGTRIRERLDAAVQDVDLSHVVTAIIADAEFFITKDAALVDALRPAAADFGLSVMEPAEFISTADEILSKGNYEPRRLEGTLLTVRRVSRNDSIEELVGRFVNSARGETKNKFRASLRQALSKPDTYDFHVFELKASEHSGSEIVGMLVLANPPAAVDVSLMRVSKTAIKRLVADQLTMVAVRQSMARGLKVTVVSDKTLGETEVNALQDAGFFMSGTDYVKHSFAGMWSPERLGREIKHIEQQTRSLPTTVSKTVQALMRIEGFDPAAHFAIEGTFWPLILTSDRIVNYVISIRPEWALHLFESRIAASSLFASDTEKMLRLRNVYYRAARGSKLQVQSRILWYVSKGSGSHPFAGHISATSVLDNSIVLPWQQAYRRYTRFGIYREDQVEALAQKDSAKRVHVLEFGRTLLLPSPVPIRKVRAILREQNVSSNGFVAPWEAPPRFAKQILIEGGLKLEV